MPAECEIFKSDRILSEIKLLKDREKIHEIDEALEKIVIFAISGEYYALPGREVLEIVPAGDISPIPGTPKCIPGLIELRGEIESVLDLRTVLGIPVNERSGNYILIAQSGSIRSGVLVDSVEDVADVTLSAIMSAPATLGAETREYVAGRLDCGDRSVILLDLGNIFARAMVA